MNSYVYTPFSNVYNSIIRHQISFNWCHFLTLGGPLEVVLVELEVELVNVLVCFQDKDQLYGYCFHYSLVDACFEHELHLAQNCLCHSQIGFLISERKIFLSWHFPVRIGNNRMNKDSTDIWQLGIINIFVKIPSRELCNQILHLP